MSGATLTESVTDPIGSGVYRGFSSTDPSDPIVSVTITTSDPRAFPAISGIVRVGQTTEPAAVPEPASLT